MSSEARSRAYDSPGRRAAAQRNRVAVLDVAGRLFSERGWHGTSMREIAAGAGVSVETVYASIGGKQQLLSRLIDISVVGDDDPVDLAGRAEFQRLAVGTRRERIRAAAELTAAINERGGGLVRALEHAAITEPELDGLLLRVLERRLVSLDHALRLMVGGSSDLLRRKVYALSGPHLFWQLREQLGLSREQYVDFLVEIYEDLIVRATGAGSTEQTHPEETQP